MKLLFIGRESGENIQKIKEKLNRLNAMQYTQFNENKQFS